jgi:short-subunit dehydrogenase
MIRIGMDSVAVVTGASSGIGWALAQGLAAEGYRVGLMARRKDKLDELAETIRRGGGAAAVAPGDVGSWEETAAAVTRLADELGPIDLLVANAGVGLPTLCDPVNLSDVQEMIRVNLLGVIYAFTAVLPSMLERGRGHLAAVSSLAAYKGLPGESAYCASKAAVNTYLEGLRIQLRGRGIRVTTLCPGFVRTPMTAGNSFAMPGLLEADGAARRMVRALRKKRKVYNFPWQTWLLMQLIRRLPDRVLAWLMHDYNEQAPAQVRAGTPAICPLTRTKESPPTGPWPGRLRKSG